MMILVEQSKTWILFMTSILVILLHPGGVPRVHAAAIPGNEWRRECAAQLETFHQYREHYAALRTEKVEGVTILAAQGELLAHMMHMLEHKRCMFQSVIDDLTERYDRERVARPERAHLLRERMMRYEKTVDTLTRYIKAYERRYMVVMQALELAAYQPVDRTGIAEAKNMIAERIAVVGYECTWLTTHGANPDRVHAFQRERTLLLHDYEALSALVGIDATAAARELEEVVNTYQPATTDAEREQRLRRTDQYKERLRAYREKYHIEHPLVRETAPRGYERFDERGNPTYDHRLAAYRHEHHKPGKIIY